MSHLLGPMRPPPTLELRMTAPASTSAAAAISLSCCLPVLPAVAEAQEAAQGVSGGGGGGDEEAVVHVELEPTVVPPG
eukprot:scaffold45267_cov61-Phaeocystis_antarctica.AAC.3